MNENNAWLKGIIDGQMMLSRGSGGQHESLAKALLSCANFEWEMSSPFSDPGYEL